MAVGDANGTPLTEDDYQFGWEPLSPEPSPGGRRPEPASSVLQNPAILSLMVVLAMAVLILCYYKIVSRFLASCPRRAPEPEPAGAGRNAEPAPDADADFFPEDGPWAAVPCGVDEAVIRAIPVAKFCTARKLLSSPADCAVCLVEFREQEPVRVLPRCGHAFHLPCIDAWLRSHASCPLCRACIAASLSRRWDWYDSQSEQPDEAGVPEPGAGPAPKLTRSVSLGRVAADDSGSLLMSAGFDPETPWPPAPAPARRPPGSKWSKRTLSLVSPFVPRSSSSFFGRSPFFRASSGTALSFRFGRRFRGGSFSMSPPHGGGLWRGGVVSEHYVNVGRFQCMSSPPVFVKRSSGTFSFTPNRMRAGDPEALLSPERINLSRRWP